MRERLIFLLNVTFPKGNLWFKDAPRNLCVVGGLVLLTKIVLNNVVFNKVMNALSIHSSGLCFVFPSTF